VIRGHIDLAIEKSRGENFKGWRRLILIVVWAASMGVLALGLDGIEHPPFIPYALISGAYFGALSTVSLAEEISEWRATRDYRPNCPLGRRGSGGWGRIFRRCSEAVAQRQLPGS
jgi:hypothetical protein